MRGGGAPRRAAGPGRRGTQPVLFAIEVALDRLVESWASPPDYGDRSFAAVRSWPRIVAGVLAWLMPRVGGSPGAGYGRVACWGGLVAVGHRQRYVDRRTMEGRLWVATHNSPASM